MTDSIGKNRNSASNGVNNVMKDRTQHKCLNFFNGKTDSSRCGRFPNSTETEEEELEPPPYRIAVSFYLSYFVLIFFGYLRDFLRHVGIEKNLMSQEPNREGYVPLYKNYIRFYFRNVYMRAREAFSIPICSVPSTMMKIKERISHDYNLTYEITNRTFDVINMGSYDYLGFADNSEKSTSGVKDVIKQYGTAFCSTRHELGTADLNVELENLIAEFVGTEDSMAIGMGFAANSSVIPYLVSKGCLIFSDEFNHISLVLGCRLSGAKIKVFRHNNMKHLEQLIRLSIVEGQPKTHRIWRKIIIISEGIYSMDGTICNLPALIKLKKKYKCYLYIDEAHSIGAMGSTGRGVVEYFGCNPKDIDLLMGTFSKSFNSYGGFVAGSKEVIQHLRIFCDSFIYSASISPVYASRVITTMKIIMGRDGTDEGAKRIKQLQRNTRYFRRKLRQKGFILYGSEDSPVVPLLLFFMSTIPVFVRLMLQEGIATAAIGYPATSLSTSRARFCLSSAHTKEMLDKTLDAVDKVGHLMMLDYSQKPRFQENVIY